MSAYRQHHTPAPQPMHPLLVMLLEGLAAASVGIAIAAVVYLWSVS